MKTCFLDTETCGFHGPIVLIQYKIDDEAIKLHNVWLEPAYSTLEILLEIMECRVVCYNLSFDWFHINKLYNMLRLLWDKTIVPIDQIDLMVELEKLGRDGKCLKPVGCLDLMLHARKGPYQGTMGIKPIIIRKVPDQVASSLQSLLEDKFEIDPIYMAGYKKKKKSNWDIVPSDQTGFSDVRLVFRPSTGLKAMAEFVLNRKRDSYTDVNPPPSPVELGYAPYAKAIIELKEWPTATAPPLFGAWYNGAWPLVIEQHITHWAYIGAAKAYATQDVQDTVDLYYAFGEPEFDDDDSVLAAMVGAVRYKGFSYNREKVIKAKDIFDSLIDHSIPYSASKACTEYLLRSMTKEQVMLWDRKTEGKQLEAMLEWEGDIAEAAKKVYWSRKWKYLVTLFNKFLVADRFHASFKIIGAKSTRMSGDGGINAQGVPSIDQARECFDFAFTGEQLCGGDFKAFEVVIFLATAGEGKLLDAVNSGRKIHALYGEHIYPEMDYDSIMASDGTDDNKYTRSKSAFFLNLFGGTEYALNKNIGIPKEQARQGIATFAQEYPEVGRAQAAATKPYEALISKDGIFEWSEPKNYIESLLGFKRYFDNEIMFMRGLYEIVENPPDGWSMDRVQRRKDGDSQTAAGATKSALLGAAFSIQNSIKRVAGNHRIQSTGAEILKKTQCAVWSLQPNGIRDWSIRTMNIHDELITVATPELSDQIKVIIDNIVSELREVVPLLDIDWGKGDSWAAVH